MPLRPAGVIIPVHAGRVKRNFAGYREISNGVRFAAADGSDEVLFLDDAEKTHGLVVDGDAVHAAGAEAVF